MISIELKSGIVLRFNLKSKAREKNLFNAWYSMQDMPQYASKKLKMTTDQGIIHEYPIGDIKKCVYIEKTFDYLKCETATPICKVEPKTWENSPKEAVSKEIETIIDDISGFLKKLFPEIPDIVCSQNAATLIEGIKKNKIPIDSKDAFLRKMLLEAMQAPEDRVYFFVSMYVQYWNQNGARS